MSDRPSLGFVIVLGVLTAAPTVGDVGGCNEAAAPLDASKFFRARLEITCAQCKDCGVATATCRAACDPATFAPSTFPSGCKPVEHDGQVCLRALESMSCGEFESVVAAAPIVSTECDFCPAPAAEGSR